MKKAIGIIILGLLWCNYSVADDCQSVGLTSKCLYEPIKKKSSQSTYSGNQEKIYSLERKNSELESRIEKLEKQGKKKNCMFCTSPFESIFGD
jgi:hypothetical protein